MKQLKQLQLKITEIGNSCENKIASTQKINKGNFSNVDSQISLINDKINSLIETNKIPNRTFKKSQTLFNRQKSINHNNSQIKYEKIIPKQRIIKSRAKQNNIQETQLKNNEKEQSKDIQKTKEI